MCFENMINKYGNKSYITPEEKLGKSFWPTPEFYARLLAGPLFHLYRKAAQGKCDDAAWATHSHWFGDVLEKIGCRIIVEGQDVMDSVKGACVFVANHMSTLETFLLPGIIRPHKKVTFVVKESLIKMPFFGAIMRSRNPVIVHRQNPREDLKIVLTEGKERLARGISVIVFPQHTRSTRFIPENFNTIGEKLAARAAVPVIPIALRTEAWGQGKRIKELGQIDPSIPVRVRFGKVYDDAADRKIHGEICDFIVDSLSEWQQKDRVGK